MTNSPTPAALRYLFLLFCTAVRVLSLSLPAGSVETDLTPQEKQWLASHPVIRIGPDPDAPPFEFIDSQGRYRGMSADYLAWISKKLGVEFKVVRTEKWVDLIEMARQKKVDLLPAAVASRTRLEFLSFTDPWITVPGVVISADRCRNVNELKGKTVAVVDGSIWDDYLTSRKVNIKLVRVEDLRTALELTAMSGVSAMVANLAAATTLLHQMGIGNLRVVLRLDKQTKISFAVRQDWPELVSILNKTLVAMDPSVKEQIRHRWLKFDESGWWHDPMIRKVFLFLAGGLLLVMIIFVVWTLSLKREVKKRSTALQEAHRHLIRAAKMESVGRLAAGVAHEVKNPLSIISMGVEFLAGSPNLDDEEKAVLVDMDDAVQRADKVVRGLLDYSRYSVLELKPDDVNKVIARALELVDHELRKRFIVVNRELAPLPPVLLDFNRLQQVFINLFLNSAQAMEQGGVLRITTEEYRLRTDDTHLAEHYHAGQPMIRVTVTDTGPGVSPEDIDKIFDPFYTTKDVGQGTGLGLSESRNIMELHNGSLHMINSRQGGAQAILLMPIEQGGRYEEKNHARR